MISAAKLLSDLKRIVTALERHLRERCDEVPAINEALQAEHARAIKAKRTAQTFEEWRADAATQTAVAWVLSCVFVRFLEDNQLVDPPLLSGPGERLQRARDEAALYFKSKPNDSDREYLLHVFDKLAQLRGASEVFGKFNPVHDNTNWMGPDFVRTQLLTFFQRINADTGALEHDFTDADWNTRFLGDLYQDLSEATRKKYALLQTPDFVEEFILDRTLDPALAEFGLVTNPEFSKLAEEQPNRQLTSDDVFRMIDPACGSGHFLLGAFERVFAAWEKREPNINRGELAQRALLSIHGVDINPYAVAIAKFRLLLAAMRAANVKQLKNSPKFELNLACGDSLYHGRGQQQLTLGDDWTDESHYFSTEDAKNLRRILKEGSFHAVVANPPYIAVTDTAANNAYRRLYRACKGKYALSVPFMQRIFRLAMNSDGDSGFTGQITANSFMKREFGKNLVEEFFPTVDVNCVIDTQLAHIPGHATATAIIFGRARIPVANTIRIAAGLRREDSEPIPAKDGKVWQAIVTQIDVAGSESEFVSVADIQRESFHHHPLTLSGGGATRLITHLSSMETVLQDIADAGVAVVTLDDEAFQVNHGTAKRLRIPSSFVREFITGDTVRDWGFINVEASIFPHDPESLAPIPNSIVLTHLWPLRSNLNSRLWFRQTMPERNMPWFAYGHISVKKFRRPDSVAFAFVATHNHFVPNRGSMVFNRSSPVLKFKDVSYGNQTTAIGILNSSTVAYWTRQILFCKGGGGNGRGVSAEAWERMLEFDSTKLKQLPWPPSRPQATPEHLRRLAAFEPEKLLQRTIRSFKRKPKRTFATVLLHEVSEIEERHCQMIRLQEDLDWECYRLYGLLDEDLTCHFESFGIQLGERAFEIVMARKMRDGELQTAWFERHRSTPITEIPQHWPDDYKRLVERRIEVIESDPNIALIEQPEYKRRWNTEPWDSQVQRALKSWLLDRLESYFDFDGRMKVVGSGQSAVDSQNSTGDSQLTTDDFFPPPLAEIKLVSTPQLADVARADDQFREVAEVYLGKPDIEYETLVDQLVADECVPLLPVLRYKPSGLDKRTAWERTWELQRQEDAIDARINKDTAEHSADWKPQDDNGTGPLTTDQSEQLKKHLIGDIPVPPKYKQADFLKSTFWKLRGKLDVPKERWVSFPFCEGPDGSTVIAWAGYNHLQLTEAVANYCTWIREEVGGREDPRLVPLLASVQELLPWVKQWHNEIDPEFQTRAGDEFQGFLNSQLRDLGLEEKQLTEWQPPKRIAKKKAANKKTAKKKATKKKT